MQPGCCETRAGRGMGSARDRRLGKQRVHGVVELLQVHLQLVQYEQQVVPAQREDVGEVAVARAERAGLLHHRRQAVDYARVEAPAAALEVGARGEQATAAAEIGLGGGGAALRLQEDAPLQPHVLKLAQRQELLHATAEAVEGDPRQRGGARRHKHRTRWEALLKRSHRRLRALHQRGDQVAREARADGLHRRGVEAVIEQREVQSPQYAAHPLHLLRQSLELGRRHTPRREEQWRTAKQHWVPCAVQQPAALPHQILALRDSDGGSHLDEGGAARVALDVHLRHQRLHGRLLCFTKGGRLPVQQRLPGPVICAARRRLTLRCTCGIRGASQAPGYLAHAPRKRAGGTQVGQGGAARGKGLLRSGARRQHHAQQHAERHACNDARQAGARHPQRLGVVLDAPKHQAEGDGQQLGGVVVAPLEGELPEGGVQHHGGAGHEEPGIGGHARHPHRDGAARQRACYALQPLLHCLAQHRLRRHDDRDRRPLTAL
mmetsp:Transcript_39769/g.100859  ORF Transcript_39769/g.100859 Transcript_39769/m.100859 type:complete len:491 (+) Transcript_39769:293-1765(+)